MPQLKAPLLIFTLGAALLFGGCASGPKKSVMDHLTQTQSSQKKISVPFIKQPQYLCGPTVLKMASDQYQPEIPLETYKDLAFREKMKGSLKSDMISATRRTGLTPYKVTSPDVMFEMIDQNIPVIIFQNLGISWLPAWHFSLLVGYDANKNSVILHSDQTPYQDLDFPRFMATWERGEKWSYVVTDPKTIPLQASFNEALDNALIFETLGKKEIAKTIYQAMLGRWPDQYEPHSGLSQFYYAVGDLKKSIEHAKIAVQKNPDHADLKHNLNFLIKQNRKKK